MSNEGTILHADADSFYASVEQRDDPSLRGRPVIVGGGVVLAASYEAKAYGVRTPMGQVQALRLCPDAIVVPPRMETYSAASKAMFEVFEDTTPFVEGLSIDEAFLEVGGLRKISGTPTEIAVRLRRDVRERVGLPITVGVARTKFLAKVASRVAKPDGLLVVPPDRELAFLHPLPVGALWGVGPKTAEHLNQLGAQTIADILKIPEAQLIHHFGKMGADLALRARGIDDRPVETVRETKSISQEVTFDRDVQAGHELERTLRRLSEGVGYRLRQSNLNGVTVKIKLRWPDFTTLTRQTTLLQATDQDGVIYATALELFRAVWQAGRAVRLLGVGVSGLAPQQRQLSLWDTQTEKEHRLLEALDDLRQRYGSGVVHRGVRGETDDFED